MTDTTEIMKEEIAHRAELGDVDENGHLATGLFVGVMIVLLLTIWAFAG